MEVVEDFESIPHNAVSLVVKREKEITERSEQKMPNVLPGYSGGRLPGRSSKETGKEEGEINEDGGERRIRSQNRSRSVEGERRGKVSCEAGITHKSKMKKRKKAGEKGCSTMG